MNIGDRFTQWLRRAIGALLVVAIAAAISCLAPRTAASAQSLVSPVTWNQAFLWNGAPLVEPGPSDPVRNVGQASHIATVCGGLYITGGTYRLEASFDNQTWFPISGTVAIPASTASQPCSSLSAGGYFPEVRLDVLTLTADPPQGLKFKLVTNYSAAAALETPSLGTSAGDPCQDPSVIKQDAVIGVSAAGVAQLVPPAADGAAVYLCGAEFTLTGTSPTAFFTAGSGATCETGTVTFTGEMAPTSGSFLNLSMGGATLLKGSSGAGICIQVGGTSPSAQGLITYVQQ